MSDADLAAWANAGATFLAVIVALAVAVIGWVVERRQRNREAYREHVRVFGHAKLFSQRAVENLARAQDVLSRDDNLAVRAIEVELADMLAWAPSGERLVLLSPAALSAHIDTRKLVISGRDAVAKYGAAGFAHLASELNLLRASARIALNTIDDEAQKLRAP